MPESNSGSNASLSRNTQDFLYDSFYSASIGASVVALFFLLIDAVQGQPFFTPSLMGAVMFRGADAANVNAVQLDMVAYYSVVHMAAFAAIGLALAFLVREVRLHAKHPAQFFVLFFLVFEAAFLVVSRLLLPGVNEALGHFRIFLANLCAAGAMAVFLYQAHTEDAWQRFKHAANLS
jgi:hypothetical protein